MFCDSHVRKRFRHKKGKRDAGFEKAVRRFQRKHKLYVWGVLEEDTLAALAKPPKMLNHEAFLRALRERIVAAAASSRMGRVCRMAKLQSTRRRMARALSSEI